MSSLAKIEKLTRLLHLNISGCPISSFMPISMHKRLLSVIAVGCQISTLKGLDSNLALLELNLQSNPIQYTSELQTLKNFRRMHTLNLLECPVLLEPDFAKFLATLNLKGLVSFNQAPISEELHRAYHPQLYSQKVEAFRPQSIINKAHQDELQLIIAQTGVTGLGYITKKQNICYMKQSDNNQNSVTNSQSAPQQFYKQFSISIPLEFNLQNLEQLLLKQPLTILGEKLFPTDLNPTLKRLTLRNPENRQINEVELFVFPTELFLVFKTAFEKFQQ